MYPVYRGVPRQYGQGLGSIFKSAAKMAIPLLSPILKSTVNTLKKEGLKQGLAAVTDIMTLGKSPKQVLHTRGKQALKSLGKAAALSLGETLVKSIKAGNNAPLHQSSFKPRRRKVSQKHRNRRKFKHTRPLDIFD